MIDNRGLVMKLTDILVESRLYCHAIDIFTSQNGDREKVIQYINLFKLLNNKDKINSDIGEHLDYGWGMFKLFVDQHSRTTLPTKVRNDMNTLVIFDNNDMRIISPLSRESSIYYGRNTTWPEASSIMNTFSERFYIDKKTMFYITFADSRKYLLTYCNGDIERFDTNNNPLTNKQFRVDTGLTDSMFRRWYSNHHHILSCGRELDNLTEVEQLVVINDSPRLFRYITLPSYEAQKLAVRLHKDNIRYIENPKEEIRQLAI